MTNFEHTGHFSTNKIRNRRIFYSIAILAILLLSLTIDIYIIQMNSAKGLSIQLTKITTTKQTTLVNYFSADIEFTITNKGLTDVTLDRATVTLFLNNLNVQTKDFSAQVLTIKAGSANSYSGTMVSFNSNTVDILSGTSNYQVALELQAYANSGFFTSAIDVVNNDGYWGSTNSYPEATSKPTKTSTEIPNGEAQIVSVVLWVKPEYTLAEVTIKNTGNLPITSIDYTIEGIVDWSFGPANIPSPSEQGTQNWAGSELTTQGASYPVSIKVTFSDGSVSTLKTSVVAK